MTPILSHSDPSYHAELDKRSIDSVHIRYFTWVLAQALILLVAPLANFALASSPSEEQKKRASAFKLGLTETLARDSELASRTEEPDIFIQEPGNCLNHKLTPCALRSAKKSWQLPDQAVELAPASSLLIHTWAPLSFTLVQGSLLYQGPSRAELRFIDFRVHLRGTWWVQSQVQDKKVSLANLGGEISSEDKTAVVAIPYGFSNWFSLLDRKSFREQGIPQALVGSQVRPVFKRSFRSVGARRSLSVFDDHEAKVIAQSSQLLEKVIEEKAELRRLASEKEAAQQRRKQDERDAIRKKFRDRFYSP